VQTCALPISSRPRNNSTRCWRSTVSSRMSNLSHCLRWARNLFLRNHHLLRRWRQRMQFAGGESRVAKHPLVLGKSIGIAVLRGGQHNHAELRGNGRRDAVLVRDKLESDRPSTGRQCRMDFAQQSFARGNMEVMQEIREQAESVAHTVV